MSDSEDLFNFIPYPPKEPNAGESSKLNLKRKRGTSSAPHKRQRVQVYSYTKTRAQNISASSRTIKIEIYEADNQPKKACECRANKAQIDNPFWLYEEDSLQPSTAANSSSKKKAEPVKRAKKSQKKKVLPVKNPFAGESDSDSDTIKLAEDTTPPAIKRKKIAVFPDSEDEPQQPIRAVTLRSAFSQRIASGYSYQSDPTKTGQYFFELRVYNTCEAERLPHNERWKQALVTLKLATDQNTGVWAALTGLVNAGRKEMRDIRPVLYPNPNN